MAGVASATEGAPAGTTRSRLDAGALVGPYVVEGFLGGGGMGEVYRAVHRGLGRPVALKVLREDLAGAHDFQERFRREQRLMAALDHPSVLPVYEAGEDGGRLFLAMRLVEGGTLKERIAGGDADPDWVVDVLAQVAAALDAAHEAGLVHRDVKPQNVLLDGDRAFLGDFGVAFDRADPGLTQTGAFVGTLDYIAPEVLQGEPARPAADVYALGCVAFEALTGRVPFTAASVAALLFAHVRQDPPSASALRPELPAAVDDVLRRALAKAPHDRHPSASLLVHDLGWRMADVPGPASPAPPAPPAPQRAVAPPPAPSPAAAPAPDSPSAVAPPPPPAAAPPRAKGRGTFTFRVPSPPQPVPGPPAAPVPEPAALAPALPPPPGVTHLRLKAGFRYVHEPLVEDRHGLTMLGNQDVVQRLEERLVHSTGGSFLVTGFRGVGKSTVIARALERLTRSGEVAILPVAINVARPRTVEELLFEIVRRVVEALKDERLLGRMSPRVQQELLLAYARTSLSFNSTRSDSRERGSGLSLGLPALLEGLAPKLELSGRTTESLATQAAFLAYTDADVEHDFLRIVSLIERGEALPPPAGWRRFRREPPPEPWRGKLVVVIDELDKLTADEAGLRCLQELLAGLKNLLTARGVHFLFVAGPDLHDVAMQESRRGNSVYESVFSWQLYVPCLWDATDRLLDDVLAPEARDRPEAAALRGYLRFKSRGVPRLLLLELNSFVRWDREGPHLELTATDRVRMQFYTDLEEAVRAFEDPAQPLALPVDRDRWLLGAYYLTDHVLRSDGAPFTVDDLVGVEARQALHPVFGLSRGKVRRFLGHLADHGAVVMTPGRSALKTFQGDAEADHEEVFRLSEEFRARLAAFARHNEHERCDFRGAAPEHGPWSESQVGGDAGHGRYELVEVLDAAGLGHVFRARDRRTLEERAVKLVPDGAGVARQRFERMARIATRLEHPNIVRTHEVFEEDGRLGIVMDLVPGTPLDQLLRRVTLEPREAVAVAVRLADALQHVHEHGVARIDLKPSSVLVDERLNPVVLDLGLAKAAPGAAGEGERGATSITQTHALLATPAYAAPEQLRGEAADIRSDLYALGLLLYEMLAGRRARPGSFATVVSQAEAPVDVGRVEVSEELRAVLARALHPSRDSRFATPAQLRDALIAAPESPPPL